RNLGLPCSYSRRSALSSSMQRSLGATLFPYTPLFRSSSSRRDDEAPIIPILARKVREIESKAQKNKLGPTNRVKFQVIAFLVRRSEEHTSELQSRENLVCRLLLERQNRQVIQGTSQTR